MPAKPTVRQLETLLAIADCGSFAAAARLMQISQPAISKQIAALERNVGYEIFTRTHGSRPSVTQRGRALIARIPDLLQVVRTSGDRQQATPNRLGEVRVAGGDVICDLICAQLRRFHARHASCVVELVQIDPSVSSIVQLERDDIDLAYLTLPANVPNRFGEPLSTVRAGVYVATAHSQLSRWTADSDQSLPVIGPTRGTALDRELGDRLRMHGIGKWHLVARAPLAAQRIQLALQGLGAVVIMEHAVQPHLTSGRLRTISLRPLTLRRYRFVNRLRAHQAAVRQVDDFVTELLTAI